MKRRLRRAHLGTTTAALRLRISTTSFCHVSLLLQSLNEGYRCTEYPANVNHKLMSVDKIDRVASVGPYSKTGSANRSGAWAVDYEQIASPIGGRCGKHPRTVIGDGLESTRTTINREIAGWINQRLRSPAASNNLIYYITKHVFKSEQGIWRYQLVESAIVNNNIHKTILKFASS